jgi:cation-transporting ATPase 13A3/4/5
MCFDKTGTLTEDGLDVLGVQCGDSETGKFGEMLNSVDELHHAPTTILEKSMPLLFAMTTCHSVKSLNGELIGDPLDLKMFEFTQWTLEEGGLGARTASISESAQNGSSGNGGIVSTIVRPPGGKQFSLDDMIANHNNGSQIAESGEGVCFFVVGDEPC